MSTTDLGSRGTGRTGAPSADAPLGVFDSGLGGLTVVRELRARLPAENIVYLGDTARVPYGTRSATTVRRYAVGCAKLLERRGVKAIVVACNTVSAVALETLRAELDLPVMGVIVPGARAAVAAARGRKICVMGTAGTIASGAYTRAVASYSSRSEVVGIAAPLLVALAEEGWTDGAVPQLVVRRYLEPLARWRATTGDGGAAPTVADVGCIVLGCTHFPLLRSHIEAEAELALAETIPVVDSASAAAADVDRLLSERDLRTHASERGSLELCVTDLPATFERVASRFLGEPLGRVEQVDIAP